MYIKSFARLLAGVLVLILSACSVVDGPNPASVYCREKGNENVSRASPDGGQYGVCVFPDGSECPDFEYYEGRCKPGDYQVAPTPVIHQPRFMDQEYGFVMETEKECDYEGWPNKVIFNCFPEASEPFSLFVGFGWAGEEIQPLNIAVDISDFQDGGTFALLGQDVPKKLLVVNGKVKQVAYGPNLEVGDLRLSIWLVVREDDMGQIDITQEVQAQAERILSTFSLLNGETPEVKIIPQQ